MKTYQQRLLLLVVWTGIIAGCATAPKVQTEFKPTTDYSRYHTFALMPLPAASPGVDPGFMLRVAEPARQAVTGSLIAKGFRAVEQAQADLAVNLRGESVPKVDVTHWGYTQPVFTRYGRVYVQHGEVERREYDERTLAVEIYDTHTKELVWVGWTKREAQGQVKVEKVVDAIQHVLAEFPPGQKSK